MDTETFSVLAEPTRRRMLDLLLDRPRPVGELAGLLGLSQPGTSKHLRVLRDAGLVRVRQDAQRRWYELRPEPLTEIDAWLAPYRKFWSGRLDALERHLDAMPGPGPEASSPGAGRPETSKGDD
jgi:DNA-binding transcriptional ArsR family regulator